MIAAVLQCDGVSRDYHGLRPLRIEHLGVGEGERVALLGFDQPAAETFINLVTGAALPDAGEILIFGRSTAAIADSTDWLSTVDRFGIVSPRAVLLDQLTVIQNLAMPFTLLIEPPSEEVRQKAEALAAEVGLPASAWSERVTGLDAERRLLVRIGRALALGPSVLLLEHASAELDRSQIVKTGASLRTFAERRGVTVVAVTADEAFARAVADRVLTLEPASGRLRDTTRRRWF